MQLLEGSDTRVRFRIREVENDLASDLDLTDYSEYRLEIRFADDSLLEINGVADNTTEHPTVYFDIFGEYTDGREGSLTADIWGLKGAKKVRFNTDTIKGKVLNSVVVPNGL